MTPKAYVWVVLLTVAATSCGVAAFTLSIDPFQYYRVPTAYTPVYFGGRQRYQNVGIARQQKYDAVVIGTSVTENFYPSYIRQSWGMPAVKLSIGGSTGHEQMLVLEQALDTGQVKHVLWGLDAGSFYGGTKRVRDDQAPFPYFMYRPRWIINLEYLLSVDTVRLSRLVLKGYGETELDKLDTWDHRFEFSAANTIKAWGGNCEMFLEKFRPGDSAPPADLVAEMQRSVDDNLVRVVKANPKVVFHLFFPPVSVLTYIPARTVFLPVLLPFKRKVVTSLSHEPNVRIHDFQVVREMTGNLDLYKDAVHFNRTVSERIIDALRDDRYRLRGPDLDAGIVDLISQVNAFNLCEDGVSLAK